MLYTAVNQGHNEFLDNLDKNIKKIPTTTRIMIIGSTKNDSMAYVYILKCSDDSYYVGSTVDLEHRLAQHQAGVYSGYTSTRRPVTLVWSQETQTDHEAFMLERKLKGWSRAKKEALMQNDFQRIHEIVYDEYAKEKAAKNLNPPTPPAQQAP